jgi:hypothetical protein
MLRRGRLTRPQTGRCISQEIMQNGSVSPPRPGSGSRHSQCSHQVWTARCVILTGRVMAPIVSASLEHDHVLLHFSRTHWKRRRPRLPLPSAGTSDADTPDQQPAFAARIFCRLRRLDRSAWRSATDGGRDRARASAADSIDEFPPFRRPVAHPAGRASPPRR